ncbi:hypothetical protein BH11PSE10_BH11PSE10_16890 [soil metagenome]
MTEGSANGECTYPHLAEGVRAVAALSDDQRRRYLDQDFYVDFASMRAIRGELNQLPGLPDARKPRSFIVVGESQMGKSTVLEEFERDHQASDNPEGEFAKAPVLRVQFAEDGGKGLWNELSGALNIVVPSSASWTRHKKMVLKTIVDVEVKVFVVDEIANMMSYAKNTQDIALNGIKYLMNHHKRPIVLGATPEVYKVIKVDPQIRNRFKLLILRRLEPDDEMAEFLRNWEKCLPLRSASNLDEKELMAAIHKITLGLVGDIVEALKMAAKYAIGREEAITVEVLKEMGWVTQDDNDEAVGSL